MSQPVKLSDELIVDARICGAATQRSIARQVERWARLGRVMEAFLNNRQIGQLSKRVARPVSEALATVDTAEGRLRARAYLETQPYPHFETHPSKRGHLIRVDEDGKRTPGRFVNRIFKADK